MKNPAQNTGYKLVIITVKKIMEYTLVASYDAY
jgi:hypothetical protein